MRWNSLAALVLALAPHPVCSMGFCCPGPDPTLRRELANCDIALAGIAAKVHEDDGDNGSTEFQIIRVLKSNLLLGDNKNLRLPRALPSRGPWLVFVDVWKDRLDVYRAVPLTLSLLRYLQGLAAIDAESDKALLHYCFDYLEATDEIISADAHAELTGADEDVLARAARAFSPRKLRSWLRDPKTSAKRLGLYGLLLGYCGNAGDAKLLHEIAWKKAIQEKSDVDLSGILKGYVLLQPEKGWESVRESIRDGSRSFLIRYAGLRTIRFLASKHPGVISQQKLVAALAQLLEQPDITDLAIETLRKWWSWELTDRILALYTQPSHAAPIIHRAIIRYALRCPQPKAKAFVAKLRAKEPQSVADQEELLKLEEETSDKM